MRKLEMISVEVTDLRSVIRCDRCGRTIGSDAASSARHPLPATHDAYTKLDVLRIPRNDAGGVGMMKTFEFCDPCVEVLKEAAGDFGRLLDANL